MKSIVAISQNIVDLFFPNMCAACHAHLSNSEKDLCFACLQLLPKTSFHLQKNNPVEQKLFGRVDIQRGTALFYFSKESRMQEILHAIKYKKQFSLAEKMGWLMANEFQNSDWLHDIDCIIPIPLSFQKEKVRGYNQSALLAKAFAEKVNIPILQHAIKRIKNTETQTKKSKLERLQNVQDAFEWQKNQTIQNKHILLIDDVITTGATLESCIQAIQKSTSNKVSILALAYAIE
ncbi:MAG: ComF family protein [Chitinophagaceae bacterium]